MPRLKRAASSSLAASQSITKAARQGGPDVTLAASRSPSAHRLFSSSIPSHPKTPSSQDSSGQLDHGTSFEDPIELADDDDAPDSPPLELYGTIQTKIVGVRYYDGIVTPGESILCLREPSNVYDRNAVRVDNIMGSQVGHLPRNLAEKLAPYLDRGEIVLDGVLSGHKGPFDCPVRLDLYGTSDSAARSGLESKLKADKLVKATELNKNRLEAEARKANFREPKTNTSATGLSTSDLPFSHQKTLEDSEAIDFRAELGALDVLNIDEATLSTMPQASQPDAIKSPLLFHQLQVSYVSNWFAGANAFRG
jgi:SWI/SNF-related matrix-associated actin-dependent regulator of chromatin subfamily A3